MPGVVKVPTSGECVTCRLRYIYISVTVTNEVFMLPHSSTEVPVNKSIHVSNVQGQMGLNLLVSLQRKIVLKNHVDGKQVPWVIQVLRNAVGW